MRCTRRPPAAPTTTLSPRLRSKSSGPARRRWTPRADWSHARSMSKRSPMGLPEFRDRHLRTLRAAKRRIREFGVQPWLLRGGVKHLYGPAAVTYGSEEVLVITVVRNGALYVKSFMEHYLGLGVAHCVFL